MNAKEKGKGSPKLERAALLNSTIATLAMPAAGERRISAADGTYEDASPRHVPYTVAAISPDSNACELCRRGGCRFHETPSAISFFFE